jgi:hypothetical protein
MQSSSTVQTKPNGPVAAVFLAAGIGSFVLGLFVVLNEVSTDISNFLKFDANYGLGSGVGPLSGKAILDPRLPRCPHLVSRGVPGTAS